MTNSYYIPIASKNLAHYFRKGCICPVKYLKNRSEDLQNKFSEYILCSTSIFTSETNCALEVVLTSKEKITSISNHFYLLEQPIPISRVKKVIFAQERQSKITTFNINEGAAFLPNHFIEVIKEEDVIDCQELNTLELPNKAINWNNKLTSFDKLLGGIILMKFATDNFKHEAFNYFGVLSLTNSLIRSELKNQGINHDVRPFEWLVLDKAEKKLKDIKELIFSQITNNDVIEIAKTRNVSLEESYGVFSLDKITDHTVQLLAILTSYGENARMNLDTFFSDFSQGKFKRDVKGLQGIALAFGINKGYETFRNFYQTSNFKAITKFKLDNQLDYYTIESVYQYAFNNVTNNQNFDYLDSWCLKQKTKSIQGYETYDILDQTIIGNKKIVHERVVKEYESNTNLPKTYSNFLSKIQKEYSQIPISLLEKIGSLLFEEAKKVINNNSKEIATTSTVSEEREEIIRLSTMPIGKLRKEAKGIVEVNSITKDNRYDIIPKILDAKQNKLL